MTTLNILPDNWSLTKGKKNISSGSAASFSNILDEKPLSGAVNVNLDLDGMEKTISVPRMKASQLNTAVNFEIKKLYPSMADKLITLYRYETEGSGAAIYLVLFREEDCGTYFDTLAEMGISLGKMSWKGRPGYSFNSLRHPSLIIQSGGRQFISPLISAAAAVLIILSIFNILKSAEQVSSLSSLRSETLQLEKKFSLEDGLMDVRQNDLRDFINYSRLVSRNINFSSFLYELSRVKRGDLYLIRVELMGGLISLTGRAGSETEVLDFINRYNDLKKGSASLIKTEQLAQDRMVNFEIEIIP